MADFDFGSLKKNFFDTKTVVKSVAAKERRVYSRCGAFVRQRARTSIRYKRGRSEPGSPPHAHRGPGFSREKRNRKTGVVSRQPSSPLRDLLLFAWDEATRSVVVGPAVFKSPNATQSVPAPRLLEKGGTTDIYFRTSRARRGPKAVLQKSGTFRYRARPFMAPALAAEAPNFPAQFNGGSG